jgi:acyl-CoA reductase-like NAD-dependent aldehyde dehydrogenase
MELFRDHVYIDGSWVAPQGGEPEDVIDATTEEVMGRVPDANGDDVDSAVGAAMRAFQIWSLAPRDDRVAAVLALADALDRRRDDLARIMSREVGTTLPNSYRVQVDLALAVLRSMADLARQLPEYETLGNSRVVRVPVGVVAAITPWNYPLYQIAAKVAPALVSGCTVVVKPSNVAPAAAFALAEAAHEVGLPAGVLNVLTGRGVQIGEELVTHSGIDMVSLTGSVRAGRRVGELAAADVKRVTLELGGKSAALFCPGADLATAVPAAVRSSFSNNGQTCAALTRFIVPRPLLAEVEERVHAIVTGYRVGNPLEDGTDIGPVASADQFTRVQELIAAGIPEGRTMAGGLGRSEDHDRGFFVRPTVVTDLAPDALLAREEVFGPVLAIIPVKDVDEGVRVANDSEYGLSGAVYAEDDQAAVAVASRLRTGQVSINGGRMNVLAPFGGFRHSGNGRELGPYGLDEYIERMALHLPT